MRHFQHLLRPILCPVQHLLVEAQSAGFHNASQPPAEVLSQLQTLAGNLDTAVDRAKKLAKCQQDFDLTPDGFPIVQGISRWALQPLTVTEAMAC